MPNERILQHIKFDGFVTEDHYTSPQRFSGGIRIADKTRNIHGEFILNKWRTIRQKYDELKDMKLPEGVVFENAIYVEFVSDINFELVFDSFDSERNNFKLLSIKEIIINNEDKQYSIVVMLREGGISAFIKKTQQYIELNTKSGKPRHEVLIANIADIKLATLKSFWTENEEIPYPDENEEVWWEVWLRRNNFLQDENEDDKVIVQLEAVGALTPNKRIVFPEHIIRLVRGSANQLSDSLVLLDNLAELRRPKDTAEFFTRLSREEELEWVEELHNRTESRINDDSFAICLLDTGVNNKHILLNQFIPDENLDTLNPDWGTYDDYREGHGTQMAGLSLYGDLFELLNSKSSVEILHQVESIKILHEEDPNEPELYGKLTEEATSRAYTNKPHRNRLFCMAVTSKDSVYKGIPSSWSSSIDKITFGVSQNLPEKYLFINSGGNVFLEGNPRNYIAFNDTTTVKDPGQSFNALTIGSYTEKTEINPKVFPDTFPLALRGGMGPSNSTSLLWDDTWAIKPDIVFEGGNLGVQNNSIIDPDSLQLLTTNKNFQERLLSVFADTSCAAALISHFTSILYGTYSELWPETIRGLIVHSSDWTNTMLEGRDLRILNLPDKRELLRRFGYGVPDLTKALYSAKNSLTLIAEREIQPFFMEDGVIRTRDMHTYELPFPKDILHDLAEIEVRLHITLSYYIEPNPGNRNYGNKFSYQSHGLRFKMNNPLESLDDFKQRVNSEIRSDDFERITSSENWIIGPKSRNKGSIHKDIWIGTASELATKNLIAIYPVNGWYKTRPKLKKYDTTTRYSLIVSIEAPGIDIDLYTPIYNQIQIQIPTTFDT